jgi:hypothetical protein
MQPQPPRLNELWRWGPHLWEVCELCSYHNHRCHFCGDELRHAEELPGPNYHACYRDFQEEAANVR